MRNWRAALVILALGGAASAMATTHTGERVDANDTILTRNDLASETSGTRGNETRDNVTDNVTGPDGPQEAGPPNETPGLGLFAALAAAGAVAVAAARRRS